MMGALWRSIASMATLAALTLGAAAQDLDLGPVPERGVLLLRNGHSIEGKITRAGELYYVTLPNGEIRIKAADVEFCCRNVEEGYRRKRAAIRAGDVQGHLRLAQWCLRQGLLDHAGGELADALRADPRHPMIGVLQRRLQMAMDPPAKVARPTISDAAPSTPSEDGLSIRLTPEDLDRLVRGLPPGSVETFQQTIQPVLMNNCTAAGCHGPGTETEFRLLRTPVGQPPSRLLTQRNLQATLQWADSEDPDASPLLTAPIRPHGAAKIAVFTSHQIGQYQRLVEWVRQVAERPAAKVPATVAQQGKPPVRAMPAEPTGFVSPPSEKDGGGNPSPDQRPTTKPDEEEPAVNHSPIKRGAPLPRFVPADPFDPEIFNRRYCPSIPGK